MAAERRIVEFRASADGRVVSGTAVDYRDRSPSHRERVAPGAFAPVAETLRLNLLHDGGVEVGTAYLQDGPERLEFRAEVGKSAIATMIRDAYIRGASIEFHADRESRDDDGTRVIEAGRLVGLALVREPSYPQSRIEVRARMGRTMRASIPSRRRMACECLGKDACGVEFPEDVLEAGLEEAFSRAARDEGDLIAVAGDFSRALASVSRGTLRRNGEVVERWWRFDLPDTEGARAVLAVHEAAGVVIRPVIDRTASEFAAVDGVAQFTRLRIRAFAVGATDAKQGWPQPELVSTPGMPRAAPAPPRRKRLWR